MEGVEFRDGANPILTPETERPHPIDRRQVGQQQRPLQMVQQARFIPPQRLGIGFLPIAEGRHGVVPRRIEIARTDRQGAHPHGAGGQQGGGGEFCDDQVRLEFLIQGAPGAQPRAGLLGVMKADIEEHLRQRIERPHALFQRQPPSGRRRLNESTADGA